MPVVLAVKCIGYDMSASNVAIRTRILTVHRYAHQLPSLTEQALAVSGPVQLGASLLSSTGPDVAATFPVVTHETQAAALDSSKSQYPPSWLTPQQLQSRQLGMLCSISLSINLQHDVMTFTVQNNWALQE